MKILNIKTDQKQGQWNGTAVFEAIETEKFFGFLVGFFWNFDIILDTAEWLSSIATWL